MTKSTKRIEFGAYQSSSFRIHRLRFSVIFLSFKANARVYDVKSRYSPHSPPQARRLHLSACKKVAFTNEAIWAQNAGSQPSKVYSSRN